MANERSEFNITIGEKNYLFWSEFCGEISKSYSIIYWDNERSCWWKY